MVYVIGLAYAAASPLILPVVLLYSVLAWMFWRYAGAPLAPGQGHPLLRCMSKCLAVQPFAASMSTQPQLMSRTVTSGAAAPVLQH